MFTAPDSPFLVPFDGSFKQAETATSPPPDAPGKKKLKKQLEETVEELASLQRTLYADDRHAILLVFQGMDAAGKDGTIRSILSGVNPAGCQVYSFKQPSQRERDHDFLWRTACRLPQRGRIGVFNRSYYEEVLVVRVHPEYLDGQQLPLDADRNSIWRDRYTSIVTHEEHLARNGTVILKFWLNVSHEEQRQRFLARLDDPAKNWKFSSGDVTERGFWPQYMSAFEEALAATSRPWAPWYAIPADNKAYMRTSVAKLVKRALHSLKLQYPPVNAKEKKRFQEMRALLT